MDLIGDIQNSTSHTDFIPDLEGEREKAVAKYRSRKDIDEYEKPAYLYTTRQPDQVKMTPVMNRQGVGLRVRQGRSVPQEEVVSPKKSVGTLVLRSREPISRLHDTSIVKEDPTSEPDEEKKDEPFDIKRVSLKKEGKGPKPYTVAELKKYARSMNIDIVGLKKPDLVDAIQKLA
jgi:hypothetical protein